ncbi:MAG: OmpA family protein [bacterium]|nr:OmpA family protein [bacterium]
MLSLYQHTYMKRLLLIFAIIVQYNCAVAQPKQKSPVNPTDKYVEEAYNEYREQNFQKALTLVNKAISKDSTYVKSWEYKSEFENAAGNFQAAVACCLKLLVLEPDNYYNYYRLANAYRNNMQYDLAKENFQKYLTSPKKLDPRRIADVNKEIANMDICNNLVKNPVPYKPQNMGPSINTMESEYFPGMTLDNKNFYFTRRKEENGDHVQEDFYVSTALTDSTWSVAVPMPYPVNTRENEGTISITADGKFIFYTACDRKNEMGLPMGQGSCDLYFSIYNEGKWSKPVNLGVPINSNAWESQPSISSDGLSIYFSSRRQGGYGGADIYVSKFKDGRFDLPMNLGPTVNTAGDEQAPFIHYDDNTLYFSSNGLLGLGNMDVFMAKKGPDGKFQKPVNIGYPINTGGEELGLIVDRKGQYGYITTDKPGGMGGWDIYKFPLYNAIKPDPISYVKGKVFDAKTLAKIGAKIELTDLATGKIVNSINSDKVTGEFLVILNANKNYMLNVDQTDYLFYSDNFALKEHKSLEPFIIEVPLKKPEVNVDVKLANVFFDIDKFELKEESKAELDKLVLLMKKFPFMKIEIGGHTDNTGDKTKNMTLSLNRAKAVKDYLVKAGIEMTRMNAVGYGDTKPVADNKTIEGKALNRRTVFKVTSVQ